jgi:hypothetical protein
MPIIWKMSLILNLRNYKVNSDYPLIPINYSTNSLVTKHLTSKLLALNQLPHIIIPNFLLLNKDVLWVNVFAVEIGIFRVISAKSIYKCSWDSRILKLLLMLRGKNQ